MASKNSDSAGATAAAPLSGVQSVIGSARPRADLDATDLRILAILSEDARASQREIARQLEMSPSAIGERIAALVESGVIKGYTIEVDWHAIGRGLQLYLPVNTSEGHLSDVASYLMSLPEVEEVSFITGDDDMIARARFRDYEHFRNFVVSEIWECAGIRDTRSLMSLGEVDSTEGRMPKVIRSLLDDLARRPEKRIRPAGGDPS